MKARWLSAALVISLSACNGDSGGRAMGTLERDRITLTATASETVTGIAVHEGQAVRAGTLLMTLDSTRADAELNAQQALLHQAEARLKELQSGARQEEIASAAARVDGARASAVETQQQWQRSLKLRADNLIGQAELDAATARRDSAAAALRQSEEQLRELQTGTRPEQIAQAEAAVANARARVEAASKAVADLRLLAPTDSTVDALPWHRGDRVNTGTVAITLLAAEEPYARVYLPANRLENLRPGSQVNIKVDGLTELISGEIRNIRSQPAFTPYYALNERDRAALMYLTEIRFSSAALDQIRDLPTGRTLEVVLP